MIGHLTDSLVDMEKTAAIHIPLLRLQTCATWKKNSCWKCFLKSLKNFF